MKHIAALVFLTLVGFTLKAQNRTVLTTKDFKTVTDSSFKVIATKCFSHFTFEKERFDCELRLHSYTENDSIAFMLLSLRKDTKSKNKLDIPLSGFGYCQFNKMDNESAISDVVLTDVPFFKGSLNKSLKEIIEKSGIKVVGKKVYFVLLDGFSYKKYLAPADGNSVQDIMLKWKAIGETKRGDYVYSLGVYKNGIVKTDTRDCLEYPHDNLLKGKITWRREY